MIGDAALPSPSSLVIVGRAPAQLAGTVNAVQVTSVTSVLPGSFTNQCSGPGCPPIPTGCTLAATFPLLTRITGPETARNE